MIASSFRTSAAVFAVIILHVGALDTFIAAVYEHAVILPKTTVTPVSQDDAFLLMNKNIDILERAIKQAAKQGAQIIVTPEDALYGWTFTRETIFPYLEDVPDPQANWIPCQDSNRFGYTPVQVRLSCLAKNNSIYVLANMGDKKPCNRHNSMCPPNGYYQYNTNVVYDAEGKLVARYHKYHLYSEPQFDVPEKPELVTFNTTFGRFGIFTCFDIFFHDPAVTLVKDFHVDTILFPTAWMNVLPLLTAIEFHSAWAVGMRVNLLAANTHNIHMNMTGSGIYAPQSPKVYHHDMETELGKLLLAEVDSRPRNSPAYPTAVNWSAHATTIRPFPGKKNTFRAFISRDAFNFTELFENAGNLTVCQKDLCCHLSYRMLGKEEDEVYALGAFSGLHGRRRKEYWQVCTMLKCKTTNLTTCGRPVETASTRFEMFSLSGTFGTEYVIPEVLLTKIHLSPGKFEVLQDGRLVNKNGPSEPILTVSLFGRWYAKDSSSIPGGTSNSATTYLLIPILLMIVAWQIL
ncbi:pantetheine hydrolase VNN2 [Equus quagga]|uniref:pantetheine hydrolase VNN2 n=1 Tax=Equus quagga TaxID=89248 RepID=UPI001EE2F9FC|nr:pantetheine hydrolase VNN2 [Equus quagga]XP_046531668.1 pantetheine hydrolase VNN2 [Equus quagga]XP_046531669.1 pantetheine hydrolase VNN2 [Equus quagga]XP_046531671.1 pantetheine hydrolase VNN2 [Equus quagga]XP_046531672.1 pantetheine hydrolase VNN2 [Equus quagga]XP_046531673.1 pantetheine hydrolase VNN2 [Equus quagga]XP_046531674.1 pantetheine hydrolase VNN2 [Equus quagga]XP_046531675.1 pantetheine hydrolase VNN2 [Equus quagga]XP_046531676.1 pantetheine hydrolase VNN2 [Equus quagga]XP